VQDADAGASADNRKLIEDVRALKDMFPTKSLVYLREKRSGWESSLEALIDNLLNDSDNNPEPKESTGNGTIVVSDTEEENADEVAGPSTSNGNNKAIEENFKTLCELLPDVSPAFLKERAASIGGDAGQLQQFLANSMSTPVRSRLPTRKEFEARQARSAEENKIRKMSPKDFLTEFIDPHSHFMDTTSKVSENYRKDTIAYIVKHFPLLSIEQVNQLVESKNGHFLPSVKEAEIKVSGMKKKGKAALSRRVASEVPSADKDLQFLKEYIFFKMQPKIQKFEELQTAKRSRKVEKARRLGGLFECSVCLDGDCLAEESVACEAGCLFCPDCVRRGVAVQFGEDKAVLSCLVKCGAALPLSGVQPVISAAMLVKLQQKKQAEEVRLAGLEDLVQCPACSYSVCMPDPADKVIYCGNPDCKRETCRLCGEQNHVPLSCDEVEKDSEVKARKKVEDAMTDAVLRECPSCKKKFMKEEGCNKMTCQCGQNMCYLCRQPVPADYSHFYGQGAEPLPGKCPLWSDNNRLHTTEAETAGEKAKKELEVNLKHDPLKGLSKDKKPARDEETIAMNRLLRENYLGDDDDTDTDDLDSDSDEDDVDEGYDLDRDFRALRALLRGDDDDDW